MFWFIIFWFNPGTDVIFLPLTRARGAWVCPKGCDEAVWGEASSQPLRESQADARVLFLVHPIHWCSILQPATLSHTATAYCCLTAYTLVDKLLVIFWFIMFWFIIFWFIPGTDVIFLPLTRARGARDCPKGCDSAGWGEAESQYLRECLADARVLFLVHPVYCCSILPPATLSHTADRVHLGW